MWDFCWEGVAAVMIACVCLCNTWLPTTLTYDILSSDTVFRCGSYKDLIPVCF